MQMMFDQFKDKWFCKEVGRVILTGWDNKGKETGNRKQTGRRQMQHSGSDVRPFLDFGAEAFQRQAKEVFSGSVLQIFFSQSFLTFFKIYVILLYNSYKKKKSGQSFTMIYTK